MSILMRALVNGSLAPCVCARSPVRCFPAERLQAVRVAESCRSRGTVATAGRHRVCVAQASEREDSGAGAQGRPGTEDDNDDDISFVPRRKARAKGKVEPKVKVVTPTVDAALDAPPTKVGEAETAALQALAAVFVAILIEGLLVASSGFMSEEQDTWVQVGALQAVAHTSDAA